MVSGDYYGVLPLGDHKLGICIADVSGKGVSAALLMANVQAAVRAYGNESQSPAQVCGKSIGFYAKTLQRGSS
jgi:sigma-B regulation protein RsbU (phosphoserine phosphatase)